MANPQIVSKEEWLSARKKFLVKEKEFTRLYDQLNTERRGLPMVEVDKAYVFEGPDGKTTLLDMFEGRKQLVIYHFMFDPSWDAGCPSCSFMLDNVPHLSHMRARNTTFAAISRAPIDKIEAYKQRMGWTVPWYSSYGSDFNYDFHVTHNPSVAPLEYNFQELPVPEEHKSDKGEWSEELPGVSTFLRVGERIYHTNSMYARGTDLLLSTYNWLDLTALGRQEDWEEPKGRADTSAEDWLRRHDEYEVK